MANIAPAADLPYIAPYCGIFAFDKLVDELEIQPSAEDRKSVRLLKYLARIVASFAICYFSYFFVLYNAIGFAFKSFSSILSYFRGREVFAFRYTDYNKDVHKHVRLGLIDILFYFCSYAPPVQLTIAILYATFPKNFIEIAEQAVYYKLEAPDEANVGDQ